jgi:Tfp pilus assembly protein PilF
MTVTALFLRSLRLCVVLALCAAGVGATGAPAAQTSPDATFASELQAAQQAYAAGDYHRAAALYGRIVRANPVNPTYWRRSAVSHYLAGEYRESIPAYTTALEFSSCVPYRAILPGNRLLTGMRLTHEQRLCSPRSP